MLSPEEAFALVYDRHFTAFAHGAAARLIELHRRRAPNGPHTLLDLCCGTGQLARRFADEGYRVLGVDRSETMLARAAANNGDHVADGRAGFVVADATAFCIDEPVGLATSTFDALNHLPDRDALVRCFACVAAAVVPGGTFVFDVHTPVGLAQQNHVNVREMDDVFLVTRIVHDPDTGRAVARISGVVADGDGWARFAHSQSITAWSVEDVLDDLGRAGFGSAWPAVLDRLDEPLDAAAAASQPRVFFVAERDRGL